jgi:hypothetical protein
MSGGMSERVDAGTGRLVDGPEDKRNLAHSKKVAIAVAKVLVATNYDNENERDGGDDNEHCSEDST